MVLCVGPGPVFSEVVAPGPQGAALTLGPAGDAHRPAVEHHPVAEVVGLLRGRYRRLIDLLQLPLSLAFSRVLNLYGALIPYEAAEHGFLANFGLLLAAIFFTGAGAAITVNMKLVPNPGDGIVTAVAERLGRDQGFAKNVFDVGCVAVTCVLGLLAAGRIVGIGVGTIAAMIGVGRSIALVNYLGKQKMCLAAGLLQEEAPAGQEA